MRHLTRIIVVVLSSFLVLGFPGCPKPTPPTPPTPPPPSALTITTPNSLIRAEVGVPYHMQFEASGGVSPYIWSASGLPPGLNLTVGGQLLGTPLIAGTWTATIKVGDSASNHASLYLRVDSLPSTELPVSEGDSLHLILASMIQNPPSNPKCLDKSGHLIKDANGQPITGCGGGEIQGGLVIVIGSAAPTVSGVTPNFGPTTGGTSITISGTNFRSGVRVMLGTAACLSVVVVNSNQITCITPVSSAGIVNLTVTNLDGTTALLVSAYSFTNGTISPTDTNNPLATNNTSACGSPLASYCVAAFTGMSDTTNTGVGTVIYNPAPGNVSKLDIHTLLPSGTHPLAHLMGWFTTPGPGDHTQTKYASNSTSTVSGQMTDIESSGFEGVIIDWYSSLSPGIDGFSQKVRDNLASSGKMKFAIMEDQGAVFHSGDHNCSSSDHACIVSAWETDLCYMNATYFGSSAYLSMDPISHAWTTPGTSTSHPVVFTFPPSFGWTTADLNSVQTYAQNLSSNCPTTGHGLNYGPVLLINEDSSGFSSPWSGAFSWVSPSAFSLTNQYLIDGPTGNYHEAFYTNCKNHPSSICFGSAKKGFNDTNASWGTNRVVDQECGQTWVLTAGKAPTGISQLNLQGVTWNDYEEGTEVETGIDNCLSVNTISLSINTVSWSASTTNSTYAPVTSGAPLDPQVDHWAVWYCDVSNNCSVGTDEPLGTLSLDLSTICIPTGTWNIYVQLAGKPRIFNKLSPNSVSYTSTGVACPSGPSPTVTGVIPASGPTAGGTGVTVVGTNFRTGATVTFAGASATGVTVVNSTKIVATTPAGSGVADVVVTNADGTTGTLTGGFNYVTSGGGNLTISIPTGGGSVSSSPSGISCPSSCSGTFTAGATITLTATAASGWSFTGWSGLLSGSSNPSSFTMPASGSVTANFVSTTSGFSILSLPVQGTQMYTSGLFNRRLPNAGTGGPMSHLMPNSDAVISHLFSEASDGTSSILPTSTSGGIISGHFAAPGNNDYNNSALYFGKFSDPIYHLTGVKSCGSYFASIATKDSSGNISNLNVHIPSGAQFSGQGGGSDQSLSVWDESNSGLLNNWIVSIYTFQQSAPALPACGAGQTCTYNVGNGYCNADPPLQNINGVNGGSAFASNQIAAWQGLTYFSEIESGHILHANNAGVACEGTAGGAEPNVVFPNNGFGALKCTNTSEMAPPNGALFFLDYTDTQLDCINPSSLTTCTGNNGLSVPKLATVAQYARIEQLSHYGWYEADTQGPSSSAVGGIHSMHDQASQSYKYYESHGFPGAFTSTFQGFATWLNGQCSGSFTSTTNPCYTAGSGAITDPNTRWLERIWYGVAKNLSGPTCTASNACGILKHLHIADPCVAVSQAGVNSNTLSIGGITKTWNACP